MEYSKRKNLRLKEYDYSQKGYYFITLCTKDRKPLFWANNVGADITRPNLSGYGKIVEMAISSITEHYPNVKIYQYVIMPDHIHAIIFIKPTPYGTSKAPSPTSANELLPHIISTFKRFCNKEYGTNIWQYRSNDHIIRNRQDYEEHLRYIYENPMRWQFDQLYVKE